MSPTTLVPTGAAPDAATTDTHTVVDAPPTATAPPAPPPHVISDGQAPTVPAARPKPKPRPKWRRRAVLGGGALAIAALVAVAMRPTRLDVDAAPVARGALRVTVDADGKTRVRDRFVVTAPVAGRVERIAVVEGTVVRAGDVVARLAPLPIDVQTTELAQARVDAAVARLNEARTGVGEAQAVRAKAARDAERAVRMAAVGGISENEREQAELVLRVRDQALDAARARVRAATADVATARAALLAVGGGAGRATLAVRAPAAGRVLRIPERSERVIAAGTPLVELGDSRALEIVADVLSSDAVRVRPGAEVRIDDWGGDAPLVGRVRTVEPAAFTRVSALGVDEQRVNVLIDVPDAPPTLGDGYRVDTHTLVWEGRDVLLAPASAVVRDATQPARGGGEAATAFVIRDGRARRVSLLVGHRGAAAVEVRSGLAAGDAVILFPSDRVRDGTRVRAR